MYDIGQTVWVLIRLERAAALIRLQFAFCYGLASRGCGRGDGGERAAR